MQTHLFTQHRSEAPLWTCSWTCTGRLIASWFVRSVWLDDQSVHSPSWTNKAHLGQEVPWRVACEQKYSICRSPSSLQQLWPPGSVDCLLCTWQLNIKVDSSSFEKLLFPQVPGQPEHVTETHGAWREELKDQQESLQRWDFHERSQEWLRGSHLLCLLLLAVKGGPCWLGDLEDRVVVSAWTEHWIGILVSLGMFSSLSA